MNLLIWDFDGTLAYRDGMWSGAMLDVLSNHDVAHTITVADIRPHVASGFPWHEPHIPHGNSASADAWWAPMCAQFEQAYIALGIPSERAVALGVAVRDEFCRPDAWQLYDDVLPTMKELSLRGWEHVVLSNHVPELPLLVEHLGLAPIVREVFTSATIGYDKPHPQAFKHVLDRYRSVRNVWMIGDNPIADVAGAAAVGIPGILVRGSQVAGLNWCSDLAQVMDVVG